MKYINGTHAKRELNWIDKELKSIGVFEYRFCIENDCYVCENKEIFILFVEFIHQKVETL